jgi:hypothetical protein
VERLKEVGSVSWNEQPSLGMTNEVFGESASSSIISSTNPENSSRKPVKPLRLIAGLAQVIAAASSTQPQLAQIVPSSSFSDASKVLMVEAGNQPSPGEVNSGYNRRVRSMGEVAMESLLAGLEGAAGDEDGVVAPQDSAPIRNGKDSRTHAECKMFMLFGPLFRSNLIGLGTFKTY